MTNTIIIFVLGGAGAGKGTQCSRLAQKYHHVHHISVGDVLRAESRKSSSEFAAIIAENMRNGTIGPMEITVQLLGRAIEEAAGLEESHSDRPIVVLLDGKLCRVCKDQILCISLLIVVQHVTNSRSSGFPRKKDQLELFEAVIQPADFAIFLECEDQVRLERLSQRAKQEGTTRQDDNPETIQKRFSTFIATTMPVIHHLEDDHRLVRISGQGSADDTFDAIDSRLRHKRIVEGSYVGDPRRAAADYTPDQLKDC